MALCFRFSVTFSLIINVISLTTALRLHFLKYIVSYKLYTRIVDHGGSWIA
jgi:hypothetical protein